MLKKIVGMNEWMNDHDNTLINLHTRILYHFKYIWMNLLLTGIAVCHWFILAGNKMNQMTEKKTSDLLDKKRVEAQLPFTPRFCSSVLNLARSHLRSIISFFIHFYF